MTDETRARDFIAKLGHHDFAGAAAALDDRMAAALPADKLAATWGKLESQVGALKQVDDVTLKPAQDSQVALVKATFEHAQLVLRVAIDPHGKIQKTTLVQEKTLGADTTKCITDAINAYKLDGTKCTGKTVGFEMAFGRAAKD